MEKSSHSLSHYGSFITDKVGNETLNSHNYVGIDNLLANFQGVTASSYVPSSGSSTSVEVNDILIGNIRPYLRKIWQSNFTGGCSNDVLNFRVKDSLDARFVYYCLTNNDFIDYVMSGSKGTKMPRGDKSHILKYEVPRLSAEKRIEIGTFFSLIDQKIQNNLEVCRLLENLGRNFFKLATSKLSKSGSSRDNMTLDECLIRNAKKISDRVEGDLIDLSTMPENSIVLFSVNHSRNFGTNLFELEAGDFLIGAIRPYLRKVGVSPISGLRTGTVLSYKPRNAAHAAFLLFLLDSDDFKDYLIRCSKGTKMPVIDSDIVLSYRFHFSQPLIDEFNRNYNFIGIIIGLLAENLELNSLKEKLLPLVLANEISL